MVYLEPVHLGWEPVIDTWAIRFKRDRFKKKDKEEDETKEVAVPPYVTSMIERLKQMFK
jgi:dynein heavy chain